MSYIMYLCPKCRKVFKINGSGKKGKCPKCQDPVLRAIPHTYDIIIVEVEDYSDIVGKGNIYEDKV